MLEYLPIANGTASYAGEVNGEIATAKITTAAGGLIDGVSTTLFTIAAKEGKSTSTAKLFVTNNDQGLTLHRMQLIDSGVTLTFNFTSPLELSEAEFDEADFRDLGEVEFSGSRTGDGVTPSFTGSFTSADITFGAETFQPTVAGDILSVPMSLLLAGTVEASDNSWQSEFDISMTFSLAQFVGIVTMDFDVFEQYEESDGFANDYSHTTSQTISSSALLKPRVSVEVIEAQTTEGGAEEGLIRISRVSAVSPSEPLTVSFTRSGTAKFGATADYTLLDEDDNPLTGSVVIPAFADFVDIRIVSVADALAEQDETSIITLKSSTNYIIEPLAKAGTVTILDDEPRVSIAKLSDSGEGEVPGTFRISRTSTTGISKVTFTRGGTATFGPVADYTLSVNGAPLTATFIEIPDGEDHVDITVTPVNDALAELTETVILTIKAGTGFSVAPVGASATMSLTDDEPIVSIARIGDAQEGGDVGMFRITRDTTVGALNVNFSRSGTAKFGTKGDYTLSSGGVALAGTTIVIPDGEDHVDISVLAIDDTLAELTETVILTLSSTAFYTADPEAKTATALLTDNEPIVGITKLSDTGEGQAAGVFRISRDTTAGDLAVSFTRKGTAKFGATADYTMKVDGVLIPKTTVIIPDGEDHVDITVEAVDNAVAEPTESIIMTLKTSKLYTLDADAKTATMSVTDDEPTVSIVQVEDTGEGLESGIFRISRTNSTGDLSVNFNRTGTAKFGAAADYTLAAGGVNLAGTTVIIPDGEDHVDVEVLPVDDAIAELTESIILTLAPLATYTIDAQDKAATVSIEDNEVRTLSINDLAITEGSSGVKQAKFTVKLSSASSQTVSVDFFTSTEGFDLDVAASGGDDFQELSDGALVFLPGVTSRTITVDILGDAAEELDEKFKVMLENAVNATIIKSEGIGTIKNDDFVELAVTGLTFSRTTFEEFQESGSLSITITLKNLGTVAFDFVEVSIGLAEFADEGNDIEITTLFIENIPAGKTLVKTFVIDFEEEPFDGFEGLYFRTAEIIFSDPAEENDGGEPDTNDFFISATRDVRVKPSPDF